MTTRHSCVSGWTGNICVWSSVTTSVLCSVLTAESSDTSFAELNSDVVLDTCDTVLGTCDTVLDARDVELAALAFKLQLSPAAENSCSV